MWVHEKSFQEACCFLRYVFIVFDLDSRTFIGGVPATHRAGPGAAWTDVDRHTNADVHGRCGAVSDTAVH